MYKVGIWHVSTCVMCVTMCVCMQLLCRCYCVSCFSLLDTLDDDDEVLWALAEQVRSLAIVVCGVRMHRSISLLPSQPTNHCNF